MEQCLKSQLNGLGKTYINKYMQKEVYKNGERGIY